MGKSISHRHYLREMEFAWESTKETIYLPLGCLQGGSTGASQSLYWAGPIYIVNFIMDGHAVADLGRDQIGLLMLTRVLTVYQVLRLTHILTIN